jgi:pyruvate formate lyase activating enzyme
VIPCTTIDYPDHLAAVVFCQGCPWQCGYCHNRHLLDPEASETVPWDEILRFLERRRGLLDAVVFSGGEPTLQDGIESAVKAVRKMGFLLGLHTAGPYPDRLRSLLPHLDWVGMDIKAPFDEYEQITGVPGSGEAARKSAYLVRESGVARQFRTTLDPFLLREDRIESLRRMVEREWRSEFVVQRVS